MATTPRESVVPADSLASRLIADSDFHDAWSVIAADPSLSALGQFLKAVAATPAWVSACMALRNRAVALVGLKNLGALRAFDPSKPDHAYRPGDRVGIFTLFENTFDEVLLGDLDKHLTVTVAIHRKELTQSQVLVTITTVVKVHNLLGRIYMVPVKPMHRIIAPSVLHAVAA